MKSFLEFVNQPETNLQEEVAKTKKVFIGHLNKMPPLKFFEIASKLYKTYGGKIKNSSVTIEEKIDGSALRVGQDQAGKSFIESSTSPSTFNVGDFRLRDLSKGYSGEIGKHFDHLLDTFQKHKGVQGVLSKYNNGAGIKVIGEILYVPMGVQDAETIRFIRISYDKQHLGSEWTFVPFDVITGDGSTHPEKESVIQDLLKLSSEKHRFHSAKIRLDTDIDLSLDLENFQKDFAERYANLEELLKSRKKIDAELKAHITAGIATYQKEIANRIMQSIKSGSLGKSFEGVVVKMDDGTIFKIVTDDFINNKDLFKTEDMAKTILENLTLAEGGNAVSGVVPINQENSLPTVKEVYRIFLPALGLGEGDVALLGSTGKKAPGAKSGDIDIAVSSKALMRSKKIETLNDMLETIQRIAKKNGLDAVVMKGIGIVSVGFPITPADGSQEGSKVQVDFMIVDNVKYAAWSYFSPSYLESELKGLYRNEVNYAVAKYAGYAIHQVDPKSKDPVEWTRHMFNLGRGLERGTQSKISPKTGKIVKASTYTEKVLVSDDPDQVVAFLYGDKYKARDILTFDQALKAVLANTFPYQQHRKQILQMVADGIREKGYPIPENLAKLV